MTDILGFDQVTGSDYVVGDIALPNLVSPRSYSLGYGESTLTFIRSLQASPSSATSTIVASTLYAQPFHIGTMTTMDRIGCQVTTLGSGSAVRLGVYDCDGVGGFPGTLILDAGTVASTSTGVKTITINLTMYGNYWCVMICSATAPVMRGSGAQPGIANNVIGSGNISGAASGLLAIASVSSYFTALPQSLAEDTFTETSLFPSIHFRAA